MANLRDIKRRIRSVKNTGKITRAMQLVAASKMKRAQDAAIAARPYAQLLAEILTALPKGTGDDKGLLAHPMLARREIKHRGVLVISTDKGLAGALNSNMFRFLAAEFDRDTTRFVSVGRKGSQFLARTGRNLIAQFSLTDRPPFREVRPVVETLVKAFEEGEIDTIEVVYPRFVNNLSQVVTRDQLAPIPDLQSFIESHKGRPDYTADAPIPNDNREMVFEPSPKEILSELVSLYVRRKIYQKILEAQASEHSARMVAMKTATDNAKDLAAKLTLTYNKVRQAAITQEILEISAASSS